MKRVYDPFKKAIVEKVELEAQQSEAAEQAAASEPPSADIDLKGLLDKTRLGLYREITNLVRATADGPLNKDQSQALINYTNLLTKLVKEEDELFANLTDEQLEAALKK